MTKLLRPHAEQHYADELAALERADDRPRPPQWRLSPWAVTTYLLGGEAEEKLRELPGRDIRRLCDVLSARAAMLRELS